jgi:hypothetical protein
MNTITRQDFRYNFALLTNGELSQLESFLTVEEKEAYIDTLPINPRDIHEDLHIEKQLFLTEFGLDYHLVTDRELFTRLTDSDNALFKQALAEIIYISDWSRVFEGSPSNSLEINLFYLMLFKVDDFGLEAEDVFDIYDLGGTRFSKDKESGPYHPPIYRTIDLEADDPSCSGLPIDNGFCQLQYNLLDLPKSFSYLLENEKYLEFYVKSKSHHYTEGDELRGRYCFLSRVADHIDNPHIRRVFQEESGQIEPRHAGPEFEFRKTLVEHTLIYGMIDNPGANDLLYKLSGDSEHALIDYKNEVHDAFAEMGERLKMYRHRFLDLLLELDSLDKKFAKKEIVDKHLKLMKLLDVTHNFFIFWEDMYDETEHADLKTEMDYHGGRDLSKVWESSIENDVIEHNHISRRLFDGFEFYKKMQTNVIDAYIKRNRIFGLVSIEEVIGLFADEHLLSFQFQSGDKKLQGIDASYIEQLHQSKSLAAVHRCLNAYSELDRQYLKNVRSTRNTELQTLLKKFDKVAEALPNLNSDLSNSDKGFGFSIRINPIKIPTPRDIEREVGGVIDSAGRVINQSGQIVVNIYEAVRIGGENLFEEAGAGLNNLKLFLEEKGPEFETWLRRDFGGDLDEAINNIIIKPINWIFCGGKQPPDEPSEEDGCVDGGVQCTSDGNDTSCTLTDSQGNPSTVSNPAQAITDEQLQWMRQVELEDMLNSMEFTEHMESLLESANDAHTLRLMLARKQRELADKVNGDLPTDPEELQRLSDEINTQREIIDLIEAGVGAAANNIINTFKDLINIAQTVEDVKAAFNFVAENGVAGYIDAVSDAFASAWDEYQQADDIGKAEIIGIVASEVGMILVPVGAVAKFGKTALKAAATSSPIRKTTLHITEAAHKYLGNTSGAKLGQMIGDLRQGAKAQGNFTFSAPATSREAAFLGESWVGQGAIKKPYGSNYPGKFKYVSKDGNRVYREPVYKRNDKKVVANYEYKGPTGSMHNGHLDIVDKDKLFDFRRNLVISYGANESVTVSS